MDDQNYNFLSTLLPYLGEEWYVEDLGHCNYCLVHKSDVKVENHFAATNFDDYMYADTNDGENIFHGLHVDVHPRTLAAWVRETREFIRLSPDQRLIYTAGLSRGWDHDKSIAAARDTHRVEANIKKETA